MSKNVERIVYPGEVLRNLESVKGVTVLGPGLRKSESERNVVRITKAGKLRFKTPNIYWVDYPQKRYIPKRGDFVLGIIVKKTGDMLKVDIGSSETASLSMLAFEGATKKLKPDVQLGDVVCGKLLNAHREMEPEMVCVDSYFKAGRMGPLSNDGFVTNSSIDVVLRLLNPELPLLHTIGKRMPFEIVVGMNGRIWINAKSCKDILRILRCLEAAEAQDDKKILQICREIK